MGLNLSSTNVIAWFTPTFRAELFQQGNERVRNYSSASQGYHKFLIYQFISDNLERKYFESLRDKDLTQKEFFKLVRSSIKEEFGI
jgi:oligoendopeptidase F